MRKTKKTEIARVVEVEEAELYTKVRGYIVKARAKVYAVANKEMIDAYWNVGRLIVEKQGGADRSSYGDQLIKSLSLRLTAEFGRGYTETNLRYMRLVYLTFPIHHSLSDKLTWTHYRTLVGVENAKARAFYFDECIASGWSVRDLQRQIGTEFYKHYYEREKMNPGDNPPIGIVLGSERDETVIQYTLNEHERNLFAVKYHLHLPTVEELQRELQRERAALEEAMLLQNKKDLR